MRTDVFGAGCGHLRIAHLATADRIGLELFEFDGNDAPQDNLSFRRHGMFHLAIQDPDLEGMLAKTLAAGGKRRMSVHEYFPDKKPYRMVSGEAPFGIVFEIYSHELTDPAGCLCVGRLTPFANALFGSHTRSKNCQSRPSMKL